MGSSRLNIKQRCVFPLHRPWVALAALLSLSALVHFGFALAGSANLWEQDANSRYLRQAEAMVWGEGFVGIRCCMPLYPLMLAGLLKLFGYAPLPLLLLHCALGVTITWAGYQMGRALFSHTVGLAAGLLLALHPYLVKLTMQIIDTCPSVAFSSLGMVCLLRAWSQPSHPVRLYTLAGLFLGLATWARPGFWTVHRRTSCSHLPRASPATQTRPGLSIRRCTCPDLGGPDVAQVDAQLAQI